MWSADIRTSGGGIDAARAHAARQHRLSVVAFLDVRAGPRALAHLRERGLAPRDVSAMPAAAGGPKGLALLPFDRRFALEWLPAMTRVELVGASIGAWRMAALAQVDGVGALARLQQAYVHGQNYAPRPSAATVGDTIREIARAVLGSAPPSWRAGVSLDVLVARSRGPLTGRNSRAAFARAAVANAFARARLAGHFERIVFHAGMPSTLDQPHDRFGLVRVAMDASNAEDALAASASIPIVSAPVADIAGAPPGDYWDGGMIDYHLLLPHAPRRHRSVSALRPARDARLARQVPAMAQSPARAPVARQRRDDRAVARVARPAAQPQASRSRGFLPLRPGPRGAHSRLGARDRRVRALRRCGDAMARESRPFAGAAALNRVAARPRVPGRFAGHRQRWQADPAWATVSRSPVWRSS